MIVCIAGKNNIAVDCLYYILSFIKKEKICVVLNKTDNLKNSWQKSLGFYARKEGIEITTLKEVQEMKDVIFLSLEFDQLLKPEKFKTNSLFNIHFSLLPEYKGMYTSLLPVLHGKEYSGVTLHEIDLGIDTGDIIAQTQIEIKNLNCGEVYNKYIKYGTELVCQNIYKLVKGTYELTPQSTINSTYFSKKFIDFSQREINPRQTAYQIQNFVKAFNFRVYQLAEFLGEEIYSSVITDKKSSLKAGTVIEDDVEKIILATIDYDIVLYKDYYSRLIGYCKVDNIKSARIIIDYVSLLDELNMEGWNPLIVAAYHGSKNLVELLLEKGANPNSQNLNGTTVLMYAKDSYLETGDLEIITLLLKAGANPNIKDIHDKDIFDYIKDVKLINYLKA